MPDKNNPVPSLLPDPLTAQKFRDQRRQDFLTLEYCRLNEKWSDHCLDLDRGVMAERQAAGDVEPFGQSGMFLTYLSRLHLRYTAGEPIEQVSEAFDDMFAWLCKWHMDYPPFLQLAEET